MGITDQMVVPGFGTGTSFGIPTTVALDSTSTFTVSVGLWLVIGGMATGVNAVLNDTNITATYTVATGATPVSFFYPADGASAQLRNSTTSVSIRMIKLQ